MSYDTKCYDLAKAFLSDFDGVTERHADQLAQDIQDAIESYLLNAADSGLKEKA